MLRGPRVAPRFHRAPGHDCRLRHPHRAVFRSADRLSPGPDRASIPHLGRHDRLLPLFRQSRRSAGLVSVRLPRRRTPETFRRNLHRAATGEFLAGRFARPGEGPHIYSPGIACGARPDGRRHRRAAFRCAVRFADEGFNFAHARIVPGRPAAGRHPRFRVARGHRNVQPWRPCRAGRHRGRGVQHAPAPAVDPEIATGACCSRERWCSACLFAIASLRRRFLPIPRGPGLSQDGRLPSRPTRIRLL